MPLESHKAHHITAKSVSWRSCIGLHLASFLPPPRCFLFLSDNVIFRGLRLSLGHFVPESPVSQLHNCVSASSLPPWQASALWTERTKRRTRLGRRLTWPLARFFQNLQKWSKSVQKCPTVVQIHNSSAFLLLPIFWISFGPLWTLLEKNGLKVMSASSLVLSSLLFLPSTVHLLATVYSVQYPIDTVETGTQEHSNANFYNHYYHYHYCCYYYCLLLTFFGTPCM